MNFNNLYNRIKLLPVYALFIVMWLMAGVEKFLTPGVPAWFKEKFSPTFLTSFPGLGFAYYQIATFEFLAGLLFLLSLIKLEFLPLRNRPFLHLGLWLSMLNFAMLGFGARLTADHSGAASLFFYFGAVAAITVFVNADESKET